MVVDKENEEAYSRVLTPNVISGEKNRTEIKLNSSIYQRENVNLKLNRKVKRIFPQKSKVILNNNEVVRYDKILIATGARPFFPDISGINGKNIFALRTLKDAEKIKSISANTDTESVSILGGGLVSLKTALSLNRYNSNINILIGSERVLSQMVDRRVSRKVEAILKEMNIDVFTGVNIEKIYDKQTNKIIEMSSGKILKCDFIVVGKGIRPNTKFAKNTNINIDDGIIVDSSLKSNVENIYAAGDVAQSKEIISDKKIIFGIWSIAVKQGKIAGRNMVLDDIENFAGEIEFNVLDLDDTVVASAGKIGGDFENSEEVFYEGENDYKKILIWDNKIIGFNMIGGLKNLKSGSIIRSLIKQQRELTKLPSPKDLISDYSYEMHRKLIRENLNFKTRRKYHG